MAWQAKNGHWRIALVVFIFLAILGGSAVAAYFAVTRDRSKHKGPTSGGAGGQNGTGTGNTTTPAPRNHTVTEHHFYGLSYSPYGLGGDVVCPPAPTSGGPCLGADQINADMEQLANLTSRIKLYDLVCPNATTTVLDFAVSSNMTVYLGVAVGPNTTENAAEISRFADIMASYGSTGVISGVVVGNEAILIEGASVSILADVIRKVRDITNSTGCNASIGTAEINNMWLGQPNSVAQSAEGRAGPDMTPVIKLVDFIGLNVHPYYSDVDPSTSNGASAAATQMTAISDYWTARGYNLPIWITETGFPSAGQPFQGIYPSLAGLNAYATQIELFSRRNRVPQFYFEPYDGDWKRRWKPFKEADYHFGLMYCNRTLKNITLPPVGAL